jgi:hypothetical protein
MMTFIEDGVTVQGLELTDDQILERERWAAEAVAADEALASEAQSKEDARLSAYEKLSGWGLTPDEIAAIIPA